MPKSEAYLLLAFGITIIVALVSYLAYLLYKITQQQPATTIQTAGILDASSQLRSWQSLNILARTVLEKQVPLTESAIRISALLHAVSPQSKDQADFRVFFQIMEQTAHIPQFDAWIALEPSQKQAYQEEMDSIERTLCDDALKAAQRLVQLSEAQCKNQP